MYRILTRSRAVFAATSVMGIGLGGSIAFADDSQRPSAGLAPEKPPMGTPFLVDPVQWCKEVASNRMDDVKWLYRNRFTEAGRKERRALLDIKGDIRPDIKLNAHYQKVYSDEFNEFALLSQDVPHVDYTSYLLAIRQPEIFLDVSIGDNAPERVVFKLYGDVQPQAAKELLAAADGFLRRHVYYSLRHTNLHRIVSGVSVHGGDLTTRDGLGGTTTSGAPFKAEGKKLPHNQPYLLSLDYGRNGKFTSRFLVTLRAAPELDADHVVIGEVVSGHDVFNRLSEVPVDSEYKPVVPITIVDCGLTQPLEIKKT